MSYNSIDREQFLTNSLDVFMRAQELSGTIALQNSLYTEIVDSGEVTTEDFLVTSSEYLQTEQLDTFAELKATVPVYEELARHRGDVELELYANTQETNALTRMTEEQVAIIEREKAFIASRIPKLKDKLDEVASYLNEGIMNQAHAILQDDRVTIDNTLSLIDELYAVAGDAWTIPQLIDTLTEQPDPDERILIEDFPVEVAPTAKEIGDKLRRRMPESILQDASLVLALILAEVPTKSFTLNDLGDALYSTDTGNASRISRISALMSNYALGKTPVIGNALTELGLRLQRGERSSHLKNGGKKVGVCRVVYRAIPIDDENNHDRIIHVGETIDWADDGWHTLVYEAPLKSL